MTSTLYLVRHGIAELPSGDTPDGERALTAAGTRKMMRAALGLKRLGIVPDVVLSSPLRRAQETAALLASTLAPDLAVEPYEPLAPGTAPADLLRGLRSYRAAAHLVLAGHQPDLGELASHLLTGSASLAPLPFKKGAVAAIEVASLPPRAAGVLRWFLTPKQLRTIGQVRSR
ncbi:MAG TPA: phosphohistidine phosphatase SixA [Candidatus Margulisiibacteriota bacterium]|nr:phosphohistidine phosphatase SixA [Candidatus Margulisiibacteriota bacterium]